MSDTIEKVRTWDWTVRLFHWSTVLLIGGLWYTAEQGMMDWHRRLGLCLLGIVNYRILWGVFGASTARFSSFIKGPMTTLSYLRSVNDPAVKQPLGHNPFGGLSVAAMILAMALQLVLGLFAVDVDGLESGPLSRHVDFDTGRFFADLHETTFNVLLALIGLHLVAIVAYRIFKNENLVGPLITGMSSDTKRSAPQEPVRAQPLRVVLCVLISVASVYMVAR